MLVEGLPPGRAELLLDFLSPLDVSNSLPVVGNQRFHFDWVHLLEGLLLLRHNADIHEGVNLALEQLDALTLHFLACEVSPDQELCEQSLLEVEEPPELVQELLEDEVGVDLPFARAGQLLENVLVLLGLKEIIPVCVQLVADEIADPVHEFLVQRLPIVKLH